MTSKLAWRPLMVEAVVIVLSILLAFWIEASWTERGEQEDLDALLELLAADVQADARDLDQFLVWSDSVGMSLERLSARRRNSPGGATDGELLDLVLYVFATAQIDPSLSAYDIARGADAWSRVPSSVKVALSEYVRGPYAVLRLRDIDAVATLVDISTEYGGLASWRAAAAAPSGGEAQALAQRQVLEFLADPRTETWMFQRTGFARAERDWQAEWAERLREIAASLEEVR